MTDTSSLSHAIARRPRSNRLLVIYRAQLSALIELERELVQTGVIRPEDRRVFSREERRGLTKRP